MRVRSLIFIVAFLLSAVTAFAANQIVSQKGLHFSSSEIVVARGQPLVFVNDDTVPHNVMSITPDNAFDLGSQQPGSATTVTFDKAGIVTVICAIHPRMRLIVTVTD